jgi:hypothetical protein
VISRFQFVDAHRDTYEVKRLCQVLDVNWSSYYKRLAGTEAGPPSSMRTGSWPRRSTRSTAPPAPRQWPPNPVRKGGIG